MAIKEGLETWQLNFSVEVQDEKVADKIFEAIQDLINNLGHTQWSGKMYHDLSMEKALETFRENKEEILAALPKEVVEAYYPDRVASSDDTVYRMRNYRAFGNGNDVKIITSDLSSDINLSSNMNTWHEEENGNDIANIDMLPDGFPEKESEEMGTVIQFPKAIESEEKE